MRNLIFEPGKTNIVKVGWSRLREWILNSQDDKKGTLPILDNSST